MPLVCSTRPRQKRIPRQSTEEAATGCRRAGSGKARDIVGIGEDAVRQTTEVIVFLCPRTGPCRRSHAALGRHERGNRRIGEHCQGDRNADAVNGQ
jgi:hypothetical protein